MTGGGPWGLTTYKVLMNFPHPQLRAPEKFTVLAAYPLRSVEAETKKLPLWFSLNTAELKDHVSFCVLCGKVHTVTLPQLS